MTQPDAFTLPFLPQVISLSGATVSTFMTTIMVGGRLNPVHIQNSTLAGGVAMGAACTLAVSGVKSLVCCWHFAGVGEGLLSRL